jgi:uncharacterized protein
MKCPVDQEPLIMTERSGVEIDYCPKCRGVWLDRGELDKIVERPTAPVPQPQPQQYAKRDRYAEQPQRKKRESFLGELFDF